MKTEFKKDPYFDNSKILENPIFAETVPLTINLHDIVIVYFDGKKYKIIDKKITDQFFIIRDTFYEQNYQTKNEIFTLDISLTVCPYTSTAIVYFDKYELAGYTCNNNMVIQRDNDFVVQLTGSTNSNKIIRRTDAKIMTFRNAISIYPDCLYLQFDDLISDNKNIKDKLIYGIEYISSNDIATKKHSCIIGKKNEYDYKNSGYEYYFESMRDELRRKSALVIPTSYNTWLKFYPDTKIIKL